MHLLSSTEGALKLLREGRQTSEQRFGSPSLLRCNARSQVLWDACYFLAFHSSLAAPLLYTTGLGLFGQHCNSSCQLGLEPPAHF